VQNYKLPAALIIILLISLSLSGCASNGVSPAEIPHKPAAYKSRNEVIAGLTKNYGHFKGISGRIRISASTAGFSFEQAGLYKYSAGKYMQFTILDMYGDVLFYAKIFKAGDKAVFFDPKRGKIRKINFDKKYAGKMLAYQRLFRVFKILLNMNSLTKIKKANQFYNTSNGFFFRYGSNSGSPYYISVSRNYLIRKITAVKNKKILEAVRFKDYVHKGGSMVPLKIYVDDYLYNVKIKVGLSSGSKIIE
jgi:hypothetical protein